MELTLDGGGRLRVREEGALVVLDVQREDDKKGLYKVWLYGGKEKMLLGTLTPERGQLYLHRRVFRQELERRGCWPVNGGECVMAFPFARNGGGWRREEHPGRLVSQELKRCFGDRPVLYRTGPEEFLLALGFDPCRPFPVPPLFCLAKVEQVEGKRCAVFRFDRQGNPLLPHNQDHTGENSGTS